MAGQQLLIESIDRRVDRRRLDQDVGTVGAVFDHAADAADLSFNPVEPVDEPLVFLRRALLFALRAVAAVFFVHRRHLAVFRIPPWGIYKIYPGGVFVK